MKLRQLYKHINNHDAAMMIIGYAGPNKFLVQWYNIVNPRHIFLMVDADTVTIKKKDMPDWKPFDPEKDIY